MVSRAQPRSAITEKFDIKENIQFEHIDHDSLPRSNRQCRERAKTQKKNSTQR